MQNIRDYTIITLTYWVFTITDGALRMLVLLYLNGRGYTPLEIASLFIFYEVFGIVTNAVGGWIGARFGLKATLFWGLALQITACSMLNVPDAYLTVIYVMIAQGLSGIAKDLTKMSSKSYIKLVISPDDQHGLMKWVAILTGSKNTLKGLGFFVGALLLTVFGFQHACLAMAIGLAIALITSYILLPKAPGKSKTKSSILDVFKTSSAVRWLSAARFFLFASRDAWFVIALPIFLKVTLGWDFWAVGGFLAIWIIGYGIIQAVAPKYVGGNNHTDASKHKPPPDAGRLILWNTILVLPLAAIATALYLDLPPTPTLIIGLTLFAFIFATNSAIHSYLIIRYADADTVALNVGFYYMANAAGRLAGTVLSGAVFQIYQQGKSGLIACIITSLILVLLSAIICIPLRAAEHNSSANSDPPN